MPEPKLEISGASVVLVGSFNPAIFQPEWFARNNLLPQGEVDNANIQIVHPQVSHFETERFVLQITTDRFSANTKPNAIAEPLRDLVLGTFYILEHTPATAIGLNRMMHFATGSEEEWHKFGDKLAPKDPWTPILEGRPGLRTLDIMAQKEPPNGPAVMVKIQPSIQVQWGVYFEINEHYPDQNNSGLKSMMEILQNRWEEAQKNGERIARHILDWAATQG
jgi:hypothetical protein